MTSVELPFQLSDLDEQIVRTYQCTQLRRWFLPPTFGFLTITNRRIVFHSSGKSFTGKSLLINEMPIDDVAGITTYEGLNINWFGFLVLAVLAYFATQIVAGLLPPFLTSFVVAILLMLPYAAVWLFTSNFLSDATKEHLLNTIDQVAPKMIHVNRDLSSYMPQTRILLYIGLVIFIWRIAASGLLGLGGSVISSLVLIVAYGIVFFLLFGRHRSFSLAIGSKTMKDKGIYIPGNSFNLLGENGTAALQTLSASPAEDAALVTRELGAMLMDIKLLGQQGIEKWKHQ